MDNLFLTDSVNPLLCIVLSDFIQYPLKKLVTFSIIITPGVGFIMLYGPEAYGPGVLWAKILPKSP